ncbi:hypothetical protein [Sorangium sp. So ce388]|uniref:hypothetical protein n=1 Tax=Sorangium sp. So ce388 TaxID=3133309 RepID=UPI003F5CAC76
MISALLGRIAGVRRRRGLCLWGRRQRRAVMRHFLRRDVGPAIAEALLAMGVEPGAAARALIGTPGTAEGVTALGATARGAAVAARAVVATAADAHQRATSATREESAAIAASPFSGHGGGGRAIGEPAHRTVRAMSSEGPGS